MNEPGKYSVIYADPPWQYRVWSKKGTGRSAESHYSTMSLEDIKALPVHLLAAKDCTLFLWVTFPLLKEAWPVLDAWGFTYKSVAFVWVKLNRKLRRALRRAGRMQGLWKRCRASAAL